MTSTSANTLIHQPSRHVRVALVAAVAIGVLVTSCGAEAGATNPPAATFTRGYSYYHDSRINETPAPGDASADHDSRINEPPAPSDVSADHDSRINETRP